MTAPDPTTTDLVIVELDAPLVEADQIIEFRDGGWTQVPVVEEKAGFTVVDRRSVR